MLPLPCAHSPEGDTIHSPSFAGTPSFVYIGCYGDENGSRALPTQLSTVDPMMTADCAAAASSAGYTYFGTQYSYRA